MCAGTVILDQLTCTTTKMRPTGGCTIDQQQRSFMFVRGPTVTFLDACAWKLSYVLYQCPDGRPKPLFR